MKSCVIVTGGGGRAAKDFMWLHKREGDERFISPSEARLIFFSKENCDVTSVLSILKAAEECKKKDMKVEAILNLAAFTDVDRFEDSPEYCSAGRCVNGLSAYSIHAASKELGDIPVVHVSSEYVLRRKASLKPYFVSEKEDISKPAYTKYGESKRMFEKTMNELGTRGTIIRTSGLYSSGYSSPINVPLNYILGEDKNWMTAFSDWYFSPTSSAELFCAVSQVLRMIVKTCTTPPRLINVSCGVAITKYEFAVSMISRICEITEIDVDIKISPRNISEIKDLKRPFGLCLSTELLENKFKFFDKSSRCDMIDMVLERAVNRYIDGYDKASN